MLNMAKELIGEAEKVDGAKQSELYPMSVDGLHKLENRYNSVESVELTVSYFTHGCKQLFIEGHSSRRATFI
jgi:hypothetical protein